MPPKRRSGLRIAATARIAAYHVPDGFLNTYLPRRRLVTDSRRADAVLYFVRHHRALASALPGLEQRVSPKGYLWIFWPTRDAEKSDLRAEDVRHLAHVRCLVESKNTVTLGKWVGMKLTLPRVD